MPQTKTVPVRIHEHAGRIAIDDADGYLTPVQTEALAKELAAWVKHLKAGKGPVTRLVHPDGRRVTESTGKPAWKFI
jgi:hypothetical protein